MTAAADPFLAQSTAISDWLDDLPDALWSNPSTLPGWDVRTLVGHVLGFHVGLRRLLDRPTAARPLPIAEFVAHYRRDVEALDRFTLESAGTHRPDALRAALAESRGAIVERLADALPYAIDTPRGPTTVADFLTTRVLEVVVHADDLSRSVPERDPVPLERGALALTTRTLADVLAARAPGRSVEVRIPPFAATQAVQGQRHTRGTPPNVVETDPLTWLRLATGRIAFDDAVATGALRASGARADLRPYLPLLS